MMEDQIDQAILFADITESTKLYEQIGDIEAHRRIAESLSLPKLKTQPLIFSSTTIHLQLTNTPLN